MIDLLYSLNWNALYNHSAFKFNTHFDFAIAAWQVPRNFFVVRQQDGTPIVSECNTDLLWLLRLNCYTILQVSSATLIWTHVGLSRDQMTNLIGPDTGEQHHLL